MNPRSPRTSKQRVALARAARLAVLALAAGCSNEDGLGSGTGAGSGSPPRPGAWNGGASPAIPPAPSPGGAIAPGTGSNPPPAPGFTGPPRTVPPPGPGPGTGPGGPGSTEERRTCKNIDIVFAIDNSMSMTEEQMVMGTTIFPAFATRLKAISPTLESFRVGVKDACHLPATFHTRGRGGACNFAGGARWIDSKSATLAQEFACVGAIDSSTSTCTGQNDDEQPVSAAAAALEPAANGPNAGFLRKNAILVVVAMTDEDEQPVPMRTNQQVHDRLVAIKGDPRLTVLLGIGGSRMCTGPYGGALNARNLQAITAMFAARQRGVFWDLCAGSLEEGLARAIDTIKTACDQAPPVVIE